MMAQVIALPRPQCTAIASMESVELSSNSRARSARAQISQCAGLVPVACLKWRMKLRSLMAASAASSAIGCGSAHGTCAGPTGARPRRAGYGSACRRRFPSVRFAGGAANNP